jgi:hypothetical protein
MPSGHDAMNELIRRGRSDPVDFTNHAAVNRSIREAAGVSTDPMATLPAPPGPEVEPAVWRRWCDQAHSAGMDSHALASWTAQWNLAHRQHLADRRADR